ncbi:MULTISPECIES: hypothetical protein [Chryseobacterium]|jgi:hypothetical protein|uniref:Uncharacterized protein n=1 Tax=Chryseobacterium rhizosphaerae TaxID=395937 RepID=A0ABX9IL21_9FLAO|nr:MULTISPECIES: hypothetical protein [Chryseobacterium]MBL3548889.1 hypothetical protein [Chryseobacterium sp. KMC2]MDC8101180.1 hypothetical protein [Chryseobacterium rhizosphaerae]REC75663.1 hypothetical protein DRF57_09840 [Chryseobacterium rhizosphaerae]SMC68337.1 hypothetical protein SAMN02787074_2493 [Chryseobacterium sp. YR221]GEN68844.1 hypothetical protein CRH01_34120 [Chryseobacterium rhizosphaerae]
MAGLKSFIIFYIMLVFTLFNSNWVENSLQNIPHVPHVSNIYLLDVFEDADMNTHALAAASKIIKHSAPKNDCTAGDFSAILKLSPKITLPNIAVSIICGVKSFLHLLQLY